MRSTGTGDFRRQVQESRRHPAVLLLALALAGCGAGQPELPPPRPLVVHSGARLSADPERMEEVHEWVTRQMENIREDPTFFIDPIGAAEDSYPWETLIILAGDTARFQYPRQNPDVETSYSIYAHFHLMQRMGRLDEWLPEAENERGYALERAMVARLADSWLLGRAIFDTQPHRIMDELVYAKESGHLDAFLLTLRGEDFPEAKEAWTEENPEGLEDYRAWFQETFGTEPPGIRTRR